MLQNTVGTFTGYIQIHQEGYQNDPSLDNSLAATDTLFNILESQKEVRSIVPRIESYALAAIGQQSRPAMVMGIDARAERHLSNPEEHIRRGSYFESNSENAAIVGEELMRRLNAEPGDSLVLIGQGYHGRNATGLYPIKGVVSFPNPEMNRSLVYLPLKTAQYFFSADSRLTSVALQLEDPRTLDATVSDLKKRLSPSGYEVLGWPEMMPELQQAIQVDRGSGVIILLVLYMVVGFGILGTVLMMIAERNYEFGVMLSVGTPRLTIAKMLSLEVLTMSFIGALGGIAVSIPVTWYFNVNPIELSGAMASAAEQYNMSPTLQFSMAPEIFTTQAAIVLVITLLFSFIPILKAAKLNPVEAMRS